MTKDNDAQEDEVESQEETREEQKGLYVDRLDSLPRSFHIIHNTDTQPCPGHSSFQSQQPITRGTLL